MAPAEPTEFRRHDKQAVCMHCSARGSSIGAAPQHGQARVLDVFSLAPSAAGVVVLVVVAENIATGCAGK
jgi:hypothetical protein